MDNAQKAIMIGVGLFITIIIIAAVMLITGMGQDMLNSGAKQITELSDNLSKQLYNDYNGKVDLSGSEVISVMKTNYNKNGGITMGVVGGSNTKSTSVASLSSSIAKGGTYSCYVYVDPNSNTVKGMAFMKITAGSTTVPTESQAMSALSLSSSGGSSSGTSGDDYNPYGSGYRDPNAGTHSSSSGYHSSGSSSHGSSYTNPHGGGYSNPHGN